MIYFDQWEYVATILTPEQFKRLFMLLVGKAQGLDIDTPDDDQAVSMAYHLLLPQLDKDAARYDKICEKRRTAANKRWNSDTLQRDEVQMHTSAVASMQMMPTTTTTSTPTTKTTTTTNSLPLPPQGDGEKGEKIPEIFEVIEYAKSAGCDRCDEALARRFIAAQAAKGWIGTDGKPIRNWRTWFDGWYARNVSVTARPAPTSMQYDQRAYTPEELRALTDFMEGDDDG
nr:MAG TPA: hypothetical protein [Caudoviricetes sp.]